MEEFPIVTRRGSGLSTEQKVALVLLLFLGLGGVILGFKSFGANIRRPFEAQLARSSDAGYLTPTEQEAKELEASKSRDTDKDGLNDYDEQEVFKTSAFLADTDSDGFDDKTEVFSGNDPNCPVNKDCGRALVETSGNQTVDPNNLLDPSSVGSFTDTLTQGAGVGFQTEEDVIAYFQSLSIDEMRAALLEAGITQEQLDKINDETLQGIFNTAVEEAHTSGSLDTVVPPQGQTELTP